ncbi:MAG: alanine racemase [Kouleothrix sp.]
MQLVGVSKTQPPEAVAAALAAGLRDFGENRVHEAEAKLAARRPSVHMRWHLIGHLQSNKARRAAALFDLIHSVDSLHLARVLARHAAERGQTPAPHALPVLLQVNVSGQASKEGFDLAGWEARPAALAAFAAEVGRSWGCRTWRSQGLMTIAPWGSDPRARPVLTFARRGGCAIGWRSAFRPQRGARSRWV